MTSKERRIAVKKILDDPQTKEKFYYEMKPGTFSPMITVCLLKDKDQRIGKGIAICSDSESGARKIRGRGYARQRAANALAFEGNSESVLREEAIKILELCDSHLKNNSDIYKSFYNPILTDLERKILKFK